MQPLVNPFYVALTELASQASQLLRACSFNSSLSAGGIPE